MTLFADYIFTNKAVITSATNNIYITVHYDDDDEYYYAFIRKDDRTLRIESINEDDLYDFDRTETVLKEIPYLNLRSKSDEVKAQLRQIFATLKETNPEYFI